MLRIVIKPHPGAGTNSLEGSRPPTPGPGGAQGVTESPNQAAAQHAPGTEQKVPNTLAGYMGPEAGPFECEHCMHFNAPNQCNILTDPVDPEGCCNLFEPDPNKRPDHDDDDDSEQEVAADGDDTGSVEQPQ